MAIVQLKDLKVFPEIGVANFSDPFHFRITINSVQDLVEGAPLAGAARSVHL